MKYRYTPMDADITVNTGVHPTSLTRTSHVPSPPVGESLNDSDGVVTTLSVLRNCTACNRTNRTVTLTVCSPERTVRCLYGKKLYKIHCQLHTDRPLSVLQYHIATQYNASYTLTDHTLHSNTTKLHNKQQATH